MARRLRQWKRKEKIKTKIMTVCSKELPMDMEPDQSLPSSIFVPASAGLAMAAKCIEDLTN